MSVNAGVNWVDSGTVNSRYHARRVHRPHRRCTRWKRTFRESGWRRHQRVSPPLAGRNVGVTGQIGDTAAANRASWTWTLLVPRRDCRRSRVCKELYGGGNVRKLGGGAGNRMIGNGTPELVGERRVCCLQRRGAVRLGVQRVADAFEIYTGIVSWACGRYNAVRGIVQSGENLCRGAVADVENNDSGNRARRDFGVMTEKKWNICSGEKCSRIC